MKRRPADNHLTGDEWDVQGQMLLVRTGGLCEGRTPACIAPDGLVLGMPREQVEIQHRRAQGMGGTALVEANNLANLLLLCARCHRWVESRPSPPDDGADLARRRGLWVGHDYRDGVPVPVEEYPLVLASGRMVLLDPVVPEYRRHPSEWSGEWSQLVPYPGYGYS
jgi:hypothetical protein